MASRDVTTSNSDSEEFTASECSDSDVFYSDNDSEISESEDSSSAEESGENEDFEARSPWTRVYPPEDDPSGVNFVVRNPGVRNMYIYIYSMKIISVKFLLKVQLLFLINTKGFCIWFHSKSKIIVFLDCY